VKLGERGVDAVAQILRGVDQSAIQIEYEELQPIDGDGTKDMDHVFSLTGTGKRAAKEMAGRRII
jgi:hypothetical protein